ncbi:hypothetical protein FOA52_012015 [Chlamydomonas sp. UWO 241]|nr:hypothetical protein FOA52_012015 [Chlamydomonas sp. UWO 241]
MHSSAADAQGSTPAETKAKTTVDKKEKGVKAAPKTPKPKPGSGSPVLDANAKAAIAAVDAAVAKLPEQAKFSVLEEGADGAVNEALDPPNHGTKDGADGAVNEALDLSNHGTKARLPSSVAHRVHRSKELIRRPHGLPNENSV